MLSTKPSIVGYGDLSMMPAFEDIDMAVAKRSVNEIKLNQTISYWKNPFKST